MIMMRARVGDRLVPDGDHGRVGVVIGVQNADGSPPYVVKWLSDGHIAMVVPGPYTRIVAGEDGDGGQGAAEDGGDDARGPQGGDRTSAESGPRPARGMGQFSLWC
jgi:hypothetical protein